MTEKLAIGLSVWGLRAFFKGPSRSRRPVVLLKYIKIPAIFLVDQLININFAIIIILES